MEKNDLMSSKTEEDLVCFSILNLQPEGREKDNYGLLVYVWEKERELERKQREEGEMKRDYQTRPNPRATKPDHPEAAPKTPTQSYPRLRWVNNPAQNWGGTRSSCFVVINTQQYQRLLMNVCGKVREIRQADCRCCQLLQGKWVSL